MKRFFALALGPVLIALCAESMVAQQVAISLRQPPPNQLALTDMWQLTVIYIGTGATGAAQPINVRLVGTVFSLDQRQGAYIVRATTSTFTLNPGTRIFTPQTINVGAPIQTQWTNQKIRDAVTSTGQFPTGQYRVCVDIMFVAVNGERVLGTDCFDATVELASPPMLLSPASGTTVELKYPIFTWTPPVPLSPRARVQYVIRMVEIHARQTAGAAMQINPSWLEQPALGGTTMQYPPSARDLKAGQRYAWMVLASSNDIPLGKSEVWEFTYQPAGVPMTPAAPAALKSKDKLDVLEELLRSCRDAAGAVKPVIQN